MKIKNFKSEDKKCFTLVELLIVIGILIILISLTVPAFHHFQKETDLNNSVKEIVNVLRTAQNKTLASEGASQWGVYFSTLTEPHQFILFKGPTFNSGGEIHQLPSSVEIYDINLNGGGTEVVFDRLIGSTSQFGKISLKLKSLPEKTQSVFIQNSGQISLNEENAPSDVGRIKDSRHIHFDYDRPIDILSEKLILTFEEGTIQEINIQDNLKDGQIYWEGEIDIGGENQKIKIHTHRLNNPDSLFSIHRDRRNNNKALTVSISGDSSGSLIECSADGLTTTFSSIYVKNFQWQ